MSAPRLRSLGGGQAPEGIASDLCLVLLFDEATRRALGPVLKTSLPEPVTPEAEAALTQLTQSFDVDPDALGRAVKACRFLLREAARRNVGPHTLGLDLDALSGDSEIVREVVVPCYEAARALVQRESLVRTLTDHGGVLVGVDWRSDTIGRSSRGAALGGQVAWVTLRIQEGDRAHRVSFQAVPAILEELKAACEELLKPNR